MSAGGHTPFIPHIPYEKVLNQIRDGIYITDTKNKIIFWNHGAEELTGIHRDDVLGHLCKSVLKISIKDRMNSSLCESNNCPLNQAMRNDNSFIYPHLVFFQTSWGRIPISLSVGPLHNDQGEIIGGISVFRDMSDEYRQRKLAGEIQRKMITLEKIKQNGLLIDTYYSPVDEIGGDFLEAFFLDNKNLVATIADATGHGISASLFTVIYKTLLHASFNRSQAPSAVLNNVNKGFLETAQIDGYYLTAMMVNFNPVTMRGSLASAGHPPALIFKKNNKGYELRSSIKTQSLMIGIDQYADYYDIDFYLSPGEIMLLASDGMYEAQCSDGKAFGQEGLEDFLKHYTGYDLLRDLSHHIQKRSKYLELIDDLSLLKIEVLNQ